MIVDLLVIGAGLAGLIAALRAAEAGLRVKLIAKGMGALYWTPGTIDVLGYLGAEARAVERPWERIDDLPERHPYRIVGARRAQEALDWFRACVAELGLDYGGREDGGNAHTPSPAGAWRPSYLLPAGQRAGDVKDGRPMVIVGFQGMRDFYPHLIARNLEAQGQAARAAVLPWSVLSERRDRNSVQLAEALDEPTTQQRLIDALRLVVKPGERIGLPAILGREAHSQVLTALTQALNAAVFEIATLPPSVPGVRLATALRRSLERRGVRVEIGMEAIGFHAQDGMIEFVETATSARPLKHRAKAFLLATGGVLGGGFDSNPSGRFWETIFDLPLTTPQDRRQWFRPLFLDPQGHPALRGGVAVNDAFQPIDAAGNVVYANLWAAGGLLAHADPIAERSLEGIAIVSAVAAVEAIKAGNMVHV
ncbi:MAG: glycerol-3-phosphate dehydrogenase subunit GlpB [Caldilinea sp.]|nr:glycerol-3-phosphate dehydrogenase subunit GlpB [Caldilinea sp.]MDW8440807.1 glycerol-3-phosphate dehydrogenase subunit GlpB [Caldilineaceae bacterium]